MSNLMLLTLFVTLGPALGLHFLFGRPLKSLLILGMISLGVARVCWLNPHGSEKLLLIGLCWFCFAGLVILIRALQNPPQARVAIEGTGLNSAC